MNWTDDRGSFTRRVFVSRADNVVVLSFDAERPRALTFDVRLAQRAREKANTWGVQDNVARGVKNVETSSHLGWLTYRSVLADGTAYSVVARVLPSGGHMRAAATGLRITRAKRVLVLLRIEPASSKNATAEDTEADLRKLKPSFDALLARHIAIHGAIVNRVALDLHGGEDRYLSLEKLQAKAALGNPSPALLEKIFDAGRYTILSATGDWPPNLQGKWNGTWGPAWAGGYTLDGNLESATASMLNANMPELMPSLFTFIEHMLPEMRANAQEMYGARGVLVPVQIATSGYHNQFSTEYPLAFWTAGAGWVAHYYFDYYLYTGDKEFLRNRALPFMREAAAFYQDFLQEGAEGKYVFNPSYSPENTPRNSNSQAAVNATMDVAVARELFANLINACEILNVEPDSVERWKVLLAKLPEYQVNSDGALKEWTWPGLDDQYAHRHLSHLYPLYFGMPADIANDSKLAKAFRVAAEGRLQWRASKGGGEMAFGMVQLGQVATSLNDGESAYAIIRGLAQRNYFGNVMSSHDPGPAIFNADASGGVPDVLIRMLVQSQPGVVALLPALPQELSSGEIRGALAKGQIEVRKLEWQPGRCNVLLHSVPAQTITISTPHNIVRADIRGPGQITGNGLRTMQVVLPGNTEVALSVTMN